MSATCSSCGAPVIWAVTEAGKRMPVDPQIATDGNVDLLEGNPPRAVYVRQGQGRHVSHFATCPNAAKHRRKA